MASGLPTEGSVLDPSCAILCNFANTYWGANDCQAEGWEEREAQPVIYVAARLMLKNMFVKIFKLLISTKVSFPLGSAAGM